MHVALPVLRALLIEEAAGRERSAAASRRAAAAFPTGKRFDAWKPDASSIPLRVDGHSGQSDARGSGVSNRVLSLDCDLVVHPDDLAAFIHAEDAVLGVLEVQRNEPVFVRVSDGADGLHARDFDRQYRAGDYEWSGLIAFDPIGPHIGSTRRHVFERVAGLLPIRAPVIHAREVDYSD